VTHCSLLIITSAKFRTVGSQWKDQSDVGCFLHIVGTSKACNTVLEL
jgi:hypothetical protein